MKTDTRYLRASLDVEGARRTVTAPDVIPPVTLVRLARLLVGNELRLREAEQDRQRRGAGRSVEVTAARHRIEGAATVCSTLFGWAPFHYEHEASLAVTAGIEAFGLVPVPGDKQRRAFTDGCVDILLAALWGRS
jgi:hypothetical protein